MTAIREALAVLGIDQLVCAVHDRSLPSNVDEDVGCGSPAGAGAADFAGFLAELGFTGVLLGPPGRIERGNLSPYDGAVFSRSPLQLSWRALADGVDTPAGTAALLDHADVDAALLKHAGRSAERCDHQHAFDASDALLAKLHARWDRLVDDNDAAALALSADVAAFRARAPWVDDDGLYLALAEQHGSSDPAQWRDSRDRTLHDRQTPPARRAARRRELLTTFAPRIERHAREQYLLARQHDDFRRRAHDVGLVVIGDLHVGFSLGDRWSQTGLFLEGYAVGAPPSRTNPQGQPWSYPVFDPVQLTSPSSSSTSSTSMSTGPEGAALAYVRRRAAKLFDEYDGIRIDHPHGLVCPWVYRTPPPGSSLDDALAAVRDGVRLYSVGDAAGHDAVAVFDIARPAQLKAEGATRWADDWVMELDAAQVQRYSVAFDVIIDEAARHGVSTSSIACEVLSTLPHPLARVIAQHGLGRFRVTSKANVARDDDVYLPALALAEDWIMATTHDTPPIWALTQRFTDDVRAARAAHASARLTRPGPGPSGPGADDPGRAAFTAQLQASPSLLACAELATLFTSQARQVMVFVSDLLGETQTYNEAGVVNDVNWTLRVPADFRAVHAARAAQQQAFDVPWALALALTARFGDQHATLVDELAKLAKSPLPTTGSVRT